MNKEVQEVLDKLPGTPGVYIMRDHSGTVIYVGKAVSLRIGFASISSLPIGRS